MRPASSIPFLLELERGRDGALDTEVRGLSPLSLLKAVLRLPPPTFLFPRFLFLMRQAIMVIFPTETEKLRHSSFSKTPGKETDEGFLIPADSNFLRVETVPSLSVLLSPVFTEGL